MTTLRLQITLPTRVLVNEAVQKVSAEATHGAFTVLPRHVDFLAALVPGLLTFDDMDGRERFVAVDGGLLVKYGAEVLVTTRRGVIGDDLDRLRFTVEQEFREADERERDARRAMARLEADFIRRFMDLEKRAGA